MKAPFPWFGGKSQAASAVWAALGDVRNYVEPFAGSLAVLLLRPPGRGARIETVNDADGFICNAWRAIRSHPDETAEAADWPVNEADLHARHLWLLGRRHEMTERLMGDPDYCDPKIAGWWIWGQCCWIGGGWCSDKGPWICENGRMVRAEGSEGVKRQRPHLGGDGMGVHRKLPYLGGDGMGVHRKQPQISDDALREWFTALAGRLRRVRVCCGDWTRVTGRCATWAGLPAGREPCGVFLDPPYSLGERAEGCYAVDATAERDLAQECREWAIEEGRNPMMRIVLAGFEGEGHEALPAAGWHEVEWFVKGFMNGGYANRGGAGTHQHRERLWLSPACLGEKKQRIMFAEVAR